VLQAAEMFCGREADVEALLTVLAPDGPLVSYLHGIPGLGKSTLLQHFARLATTQGAQVAVMDCRLVEPTPRGFLDEWSSLLRMERVTLETAAQAVAETKKMKILCLDHYESFLLLDTWLRQDLMPVMPDNFRLVMASRRPPVPLWSTAPGWQGLFVTRNLAPLDRGAAGELLRHANVPDEHHGAIFTQTHGNPLALRLAAVAAVSHSKVTFQTSALPDVMQALTGTFLTEVPDPATRDALEKTSVARRITRSLLRALPGVDEDQFEKLRLLPFVDTWRDGLRLHDAVRDAIAGTLKATDPERYFRSRRCAWRQMRDEMSIAPRSDLWRSTADMLYLIENPVVRDAFFPSGDQDLAIESAQPHDWLQIRELIRRHDGNAAIAPLAAWWEHHPEAFRVARNRDDQVVAFYCMREATNLHQAVTAADPVAAAWQVHLANEAVPTGSRTLFLRRWLTAEIGEGPSAGQAACWLDAKRTYMELRPALRRVYLTVVDLPVYGPAAAQLGFRHLENVAIDLGAQTFLTAMLDFGPNSVDGWISGLVGDEMGIAPDSPLDHERRALVIDRQEISLTPLEYHLATYLEARRGKTATRDELLTAVWGQPEGSGSSNVVDAVVKSLRRKLGTSTQHVETVRGFGYRWGEE